jgi:protocatechuate 3,4-dioxygenase beta subunit
LPETTSLCIVSPEQTEGPYFSDVQLNRTDIRGDPATGAVSDGLPLELTFNVNHVTAASCEPFPGAIVDIWHCDADGVYSDFAAEGSAGQKFLRGHQVSDENGVVRFTTIYPGWYPGRTVHIHIKVRTTDSAGQAYEFTSQLYFDDAMTDSVYARAPYSARPNRTTRNSNDGIYSDSSEQLLIGISETAEGYAGTFDLGVFMS